MTLSYIQIDTFLSFNLIYNTYASGTSDNLFGYISIIPLPIFNKLTNIVRNVNMRHIIIIIIGTGALEILYSIRNFTAENE